jgi:probable addiction module antidote protein
MNAKDKKPSPVTEAILEMADDMHRAGIMDDASLAKIAMRHMDRGTAPQAVPLKAAGRGVEGVKNMKTNIKPFDAAEYLDNDEVIAEYLSAAADDPNPDVFLAALGDVAKARGMAQIAKDSGLGRESLYKALSSGAHPRYETVQAVLRALGVKLAVVANQR